MRCVRLACEQAGTTESTNSLHDMHAQGVAEAHPERLLRPSLEQPVMFD